MHQPHISSGGRYPILRTIAILWLVSAVLALVYGLYQASVALAGDTSLEVVRISGGHWTSRLIAFFIWLAVTFFVVILNVAIAELIKLFMDVEHNTRITALSTTATADVTGAGGAPRVENGRGSRFGDQEESAEGALLRGH